MIFVLVATKRLPLLKAMPVALGRLSIRTLALWSPFSGMTYTLLATNSELTKMLPLSPWRSSRASSTPEAQVSTLKPGGSLKFLVGSLSGAVGIGNAGTGAIFMADSLFGRPLAHPGSSSFGFASAGAGGTGDGDAGFGCACAGKPAQQSVASAMSDRMCFMTGSPG